MDAEKFVIISLCWVAGSIIGFLPLFGWHAATSDHISCFFVKVMDYDFLVFLYFATIITPSLILAAFYAHIYRVVVKQLQQIVTMNPSRGSSLRNGNVVMNPGSSNGGTMLRMLGAAQKREVKATQNLSIIVLFFIICWIPLYTINCVKAFCPDCYIGATWTDFCIILSHLNSAVNPILYAYHLKDFRAALKSLIYKMFGLKESNPPSETYYKPSIISQHQRRLSNLENRSNTIHNNQPKIYVDSPVWLRQKAAELTTLSIEPSYASRAASPASLESNCIGQSGQTNSPENLHRRKIWMISEVPSISDEQKDESAPATSQVETSQYMIESYTEEYDEDDEVFLPASDKQTILYNFSSDEYFSTDIEFNEENSNDLSDNFSTKTLKYRMNNEEKELNNMTPLNSPQAINSIFLVDNDLNEILLTKKQDSNEVKECVRSPTKSLRLSPLKIVNDFILGHTLKKSTNININDEKIKPCKDTLLKKSSSDIFQYLDLHKNSTQKLKTNHDIENR